MNYGFRIVFHKDIPWSKELEKCLLGFVESFTSEGSYKRGGNTRTWYRRNSLGIGFDNNFKAISWCGGDHPFFFKRLSTKRRIFGIIPSTELEISKTKTVGEVIPRCSLKIPYKEEDYITFFETGKIKG